MVFRNPPQLPARTTEILGLSFSAFHLAGQAGNNNLSLVPATHVPQQRSDRCQGCPRHSSAPQKGKKPRARESQDTAKPFLFTNKSLTHTCKSLGWPRSFPPSSRSFSRPLLHGARRPASTDDRSQPAERWWALAPQLNAPIYAG